MRLFVPIVRQTLRCCGPFRRGLGTERSRFRTDFTHGRWKDRSRLALAQSCLRGEHLVPQHRSSKRRPSEDWKGHWIRHGSGSRGDGRAEHGSNLAEPRVRAARRGSWNLECHAYSHPGFDRLAVQERRIVSPLHDGVRGRAYESFVNDRVERGQADQAALFSDDTFQ